MSPWYLPVVVNGQMPVTSPIAQRPSPARSCASTGMPVRVGVDADGLEPDAVDPRPATGRDEQAVAPQLGAVVERRGRSRRRRVAPRVALHAEHQLDAVATEDLAERLAQRRGLVGEHALGARRRAPPRRRGGARPGPSRRRPDRRRGSAGGGGPRSSPVTSRFVHTPSSSRRPGTGGTIGVRAGGHDDVPRRCAARRRPRPRRARRAGRRRAAGRCRGRSATSRRSCRCGSRP